MPRFSPTREGFRIAFGCPSLAFAEIAWRWMVGAVGAILFTFALVEFLDTLPVSSLDADLLATRQVPLVWRAVSNIFRGSGARAALAALFGLSALSILWIVTASLGRLAILNAIIGRGSANGVGAIRFAPFRTLVGLNCLRVVAAMAALLALLAVAVISNTLFASPNAHPQLFLKFLVFAFSSAAVVLTWIALDWLLSFTSILSVRGSQGRSLRRGEDTIGAIAQAFDFLSERYRPVLAVSVCNALAHVVAFCCAASVVSLLSVLFMIVPARVAVGGILIVALAYFAFADWLYIARLAGYVCLAEMPEAFRTPKGPVAPPRDWSGRSRFSPQYAVDQDEPILSDLPGMASEPIS